MAKLNILKKDYLLLGGSILLLIMAYRFAFSRTVAEWHLHRNLTAQVAASHTLDDQPAYMERKTANLAAVIRRYRADTTLFRTGSLNSIALIAQRHEARLVSIPSADAQADTGKVLTEKVTLQGHYANLLSTADELSRTSGIGWLRSVNLSTIRKTDTLREKNELQLALYIQVLK